MYKRRRVKYPLFLEDFSETRIFWLGFRKTLKYQISLESVQWETSCSMWTGGLTDMMKLIAANLMFVPCIAWLCVKNQ
jgi:hypothetical protein